MGHPGQWKTIELITQEYWWPGITEFVKVYIKGCAICQTTKIKPPVKVPLKPKEIHHKEYGIPSQWTSSQTSQP